MSKPDFTKMTRPQFRQYILEHREDEEALQIYIDRFQNPNAKVYPAPKSLEDLENFAEIHREHLEQQRQQG
jgi:S-ribosylhomocysteine lyase LuxS involved in autoinducer biosynthesis